MKKEAKCHDVYLGLGTNLGDKKNNISRAISNIENKIGEVVSVSGLYETDPQGFNSDNMFINAACHVRTAMSAEEVLFATQEIEKKMGRTLKSVNRVYSDRIIDIDILMYDDLVYESDILVLPHPHLHERDFVITPLSDIASSVLHPVLKKTIEELKTLNDLRK
ncbi:2-amino-4-hydroxy-6-hydroxymethyldihydropteridine diphosphokinase [Dysgonomonas sp. 520]|nr:2-amino-4-hydroxy-6-hydroxymethyldihydropteridine diphosphokinase [Dysgonomonas sp. 520]NDW08682.1 2-amino-4-hydroxy-6-hydroxymethyldihydropteridine diphosphokinase [Dysgonomonas sp. 520]